MNVVISAYHETVACTWCNKSAEGVSVQFAGGFLHKSDLCFKCLQQSVRVHHKQIAESDDCLGNGGGRIAASH
jgi:hypothetical protein